MMAAGAATDQLTLASVSDHTAVKTRVSRPMRPMITGVGAGPVSQAGSDVTGRLAGAPRSVGSPIAGSADTAGIS